MADFLQWLILALVQGLTEFLPISSSAHLILASKFAGWQDQGLIMDIAAHFGSLLAVMIYYRKEVAHLLSGKDWPLFLQLLIATIPLALCGLLLAGFIDANLRSVWVIAMASAFFGVLLWVSQKWANHSKLDLKKAVYIGLAQCLSLIPGASRSGVTMTAAMTLGLSKTQAAKFSFLLAIPAILMVSIYGGIKLYQQPQAYELSGVLTFALLSFAAAFVCIHWFMRFIEKIDFVWFMLYRLLLTALILVVWYQ
ncbi:MAG: undecaprenyl-diphosphate phosphatase [Xanthomonadales bacterium]|nr:undecaprenyl-diphosphate phosphatase [Xanthomonadales bacterium]